MGRVSPGTRVNLETDLISRLVDGRPTTAAEAVSAAVANLQWAGQVSGRAGVEMAVRHFTAGGGVVIWDADSEVEGDVVFAGSRLRPQAFTFLLTRVCGHSTVPVCAGRRTFSGPGHVFPLRARPGLLDERRGHTEATMALCLAGGLPPVGVCCEVMNADGAMAGEAALEAFALR